MDWPGVPRIVLTPNVMEFKRLCESMVSLIPRYRSQGGSIRPRQSPADLDQKIDPNSDHHSLCPQLARSLQNVTIIQKGETDIISNGLQIPREFIEGQTTGSGSDEVLENQIQGGLKRVGGQGDILSGSTGVLLAWGSEWVKGSYA